MASPMNLDVSSNERLSKLEKKVMEQSKTIQHLSDIVYRTNNVLIDMVQGMFCHQTQQNVLHKHLSELTNNNVSWEPETLQDTHTSGAYPTTFQGNDHEFRITDLENILEHIIQEKKLSFRSDEPYLPLLTVDTQDDGSLDSEIIDICNDINGNGIHSDYELTIKSLRLSSLIDLFGKLKYENETKKTIVSDLKELVSAFYPEYINKYPAYFKTYDIELNKSNESITYRCDKVDEYDKVIDHIIMDNQMIDSIIKDLKKLLNEKHPECLNIYESTHEPYPYV
jgi:uncharacterized coiled-coil protein SlyX